MQRTRGAFPRAHCSATMRNQHFHCDTAALIALFASNSTRRSINGPNRPCQGLLCLRQLRAEVCVFCSFELLHLRCVFATWATTVVLLRPFCGGSDTFECANPSCGVKVDRDVNGARNIALKVLTKNCNAAQ